MPYPFTLAQQPKFTISDAIVEQMFSRHTALGDLALLNPEAIDPKLKIRLEKLGYNLSVEVIREINEKIRLRNARQKIIDSWRNQGGPSSPLGLPVDDSFPIQVAGGGYLVPFRGGNIQIDSELRVLNNELGSPCHVTFEGLILHSRQETSPDEIYGAGGFRVGSILVGDRVLTGNFIIPEVKLGGKDARNTRVSKMSQEIYRGAPVGLELFVSISEHDSGDREDVRRKVRTLIDEGAKNVATALGAGIAGGDLAQLGRVGEQISQGSFGGWLRNAAADLITDLFGLSDDPYNPGGVVITAEEMTSPPPLMVAGHQLDNKVIMYTHRVDMSGIDDAGDVGNCSAYFRVWR